MLEIEIELGRDGNFIFYKLPNGKLHRLDGPAFISKYGNDYYIEGIKYSFDDFWLKMKDTKYAKLIMANILGMKNE